MPIFLTREQIYRVLQRELPPDTYPDGVPSGFLSTAENDSVAGVLAVAYGNLSHIYDNYVPQTATDKIPDFELMMFGKYADATLSDEERRQRIINKFRAIRSISKIGVSGSILAAVPNLNFEIIEWGSETGGWLIGLSQLGIETILNGERLVDAVGPGLCNADPADFGKTPEEWAEMQLEAYTYEVRIYGHILSTAERAALEAALSQDEPARSTHVITDNLDPNDRIDGTT